MRGDASLVNERTGTASKDGGPTSCFVLIESGPLRPRRGSLGEENYVVEAGKKSYIKDDIPLKAVRLIPRKN